MGREAAPIDVVLWESLEGGLFLYPPPPPEPPKAPPRRPLEGPGRPPWSPPGASFCYPEARGAGVSWRPSSLPETPSGVWVADFPTPNRFSENHAFLRPHSPQPTLRASQEAM